MDKIRVGLMYDSAGQRVAVEAGYATIGHTSHDPKLGKHVFWFPNLASFEKYKKAIFENMSFNKPVPILDIGVADNTLQLDQTQVRGLMQTLMHFMQQAQPGDKCMLNFENGIVTPVLVAAVKNKFAPPPPPPSMSETDGVFQALAGRKIRINDFATELGKETEALKTIINGDSRFAPIVGGWVRAAGEPNND